MRSILRTLIAILGIVGLARPAFAQGKFLGALSSRDSTVAQVLERAGCDSTWIPQVLEDSHINPADEHHVPIGWKLYLRGGSCKARPPAKAEKKPEEKKVTEAVRVLESPDTLPKILAKISALRDSLATRAAKDSLLRNVATENDSLKRENTTLDHEKTELKERADTAEWKAKHSTLPGARNYWLARGIPIGAGLGLFVAVLLFLRYRKTHSDARLKWVVRGQVFPYIGAKKMAPESKVVPIYQCPRCGAEVLGTRRKLHDHLETCLP